MQTKPAMFITGIIADVISAAGYRVILPGIAVARDTPTKSQHLKGNLLGKKKKSRGGQSGFQRSNDKACGGLKL